MFVRVYDRFRQQASRVSHFGRIALTLAASVLLSGFMPGQITAAQSIAPSYEAVPESVSGADTVDVLSSASVTAYTQLAPEKLRSGIAAAGTIFPVVTIGVSDKADLVREREMLISTLEKLSRAMSGTQFRLRVIMMADGPAQLNLIRPDFMFAPVGEDALWQREGIESYRIATRKTALAKEAAQSTGSVFVTLKSRTDLNDISDLKGKNIVAGVPDSVPGWLAAMGEIKKAGFDPDEFFVSTEFLFDYYPEVVAALWGGKVDAAVFPTCLLESLEHQGLAETDELKVIHDITDDALACRRSTALYPDLSLVGFSWTPEKMVRDVTVALMRQESEGSFEWLAYVPHANVDALFRELKAGPYSYLKDFSFKALYARHRTAFWAAGAVLLSLVLYGILLQVLVRRRTRELSETLAEQRRMEAEAREHRRRLGHLERRNIVNQMSGMIAHEINSPVGAICNFKTILDLMLGEQAQKDPNIRVALDGIETEAQRIAGIVGRVRSYAKQQKHAHKPCDLVEIARGAVRALKVSTSVKAEIAEHYETPAAPVLGDSLELELLVLNLLRNANEVQPAKGNRVRINLTVRRLEDGRCRMEVRDNGKALTDRELERLTMMMQSVKPEGLGLGLSIVRGIADSHGGELEFKKAEPNGLVVIFTLDAYVNSSATEEQPDAAVEHSKNKEDGA